MKTLPTRSFLQNLRCRGAVPDARRFNELLDLLGDLLSHSESSAPWAKRHMPLEPYIGKEDEKWWCYFEIGRPIAYDGTDAFARVKVTAGSGEVPEETAFDREVPLRLELTEGEDKNVWLKTEWESSGSGSQMKAKTTGFEFELQEPDWEPGKPERDRGEEWILWNSITWAGGDTKYPQLVEDHLPFLMHLTKLEGGASSSDSGDSDSPFDEPPPVICYQSDQDDSYHEFNWSEGGQRYNETGEGLWAIEWNAVSSTWDLIGDDDSVLASQSGGDSNNPLGQYDGTPESGFVTEGPCPSDDSGGDSGSSDSDDSDDSDSGSSGGGGGGGDSDESDDTPKDTHIERVWSPLAGRMTNIAWQPMERPYGAYEDVLDVPVSRSLFGLGGVVEIHPFTLQSIVPGSLRVLSTQGVHAAVPCAGEIFESEDGKWVVWRRGKQVCIPRVYLRVWSPVFLRSPGVVRVVIEGRQRGRKRSMRWLPRTNKQLYNNAKFWAQAHEGTGEIDYAVNDKA